MPTVRVLHSQITGHVPASLGTGQIAINEADSKLFFRNVAGTVMSFDLAQTGLATQTYVNQQRDTRMPLSGGTFTGGVSIQGDMVLQNPNGSSYVSIHSLNNSLGWIRNIGTGLEYWTSNWAGTIGKNHYFHQSVNIGGGRLDVGGSCTVNGDFNTNKIAGTSISGSARASLAGLDINNTLRLWQPDNGNYSIIYFTSYRNTVYFNWDGANYIINSGNDGAVGGFYCTGDVIAYYSDERLKDVKGTIRDALGKLGTLDAVVYTSNDLGVKYGYPKDKQQIGLLAHQVKEVIPEVVERAAFDLGPDNTSKTGEDYLTIKYDRLVPVLVKAIQELSDELKNVKQQILEMKASLR
jgi:hypothetical protein